MIVHRILDAVFRTLDAVDAVRARVGSIVGAADPQPPSAWPADGDDVRHDSAAVRATYVDSPSVDDWKNSDDDGDDSEKAAPRAKAKKAPPVSVPAATEQDSGAKKATSSTPKKTTKSAKRGPQTPRPKKVKAAPEAKAESKTPTAVSRKGSVDRSGKDFDSPRAKAVKAFIEGQGRPVISVDADLDGKKTLARVLWAMIAADDAGVEGGLTAADASALLSTVAGVEVFATNVARAFRDEAELFEETSPDGRSKRYTVTDAGRARGAELIAR